MPYLTPEFAGWPPSPAPPPADDVHARLTKCIGVRAELQLALERLIDTVPYHPGCSGTGAARCALHVARDEAVETIRRLGRA